MVIHMFVQWLCVQQVIAMCIQILHTGVSIDNLIDSGHTHNLTSTSRIKGKIKNKRMFLRSEPVGVPIVHVNYETS